MGQVAPTITCMHPSRTLVCSKLRPDGFLRAGKDAARAFATGCFATHQTHDIRGLDEAEMRVRCSSTSVEFEPHETDVTFRALTTGRISMLNRTNISRLDESPILPLTPWRPYLSTVMKRRERHRRNVS